MTDAATLAALPAAELERRRQDLLLQLRDGNSPELTRQANELATAIQTQQANGRRQALLGLQPTRNANGAPASGRTSIHERDPNMLNGTARAFIDSEQLRAFRASGLNGQTSFDLESRALLDTTGAQTQKLRPFTDPVRATADRATRILDLIDRRTVGPGSVIEWVQDTSGAPGAAEVAEGATKPESTVTFAPVQTAFATIRALGEHHPAGR